MTTQAYFLSTKDNQLLFNKLKLEYIKTEFSCFTNELFYHITGSYSATIDDSSTVLFLINKILLDHVYRYINNNNRLLFIFQLHSKTFLSDLYIQPFYSNQILSRFPLSEEERYEIEQRLNKFIANYLYKMYLEDPDAWNLVFMNLYETFQQEFYGMTMAQYKFEIGHHRQPILIGHKRETLCVF